MRTLDLFLGTLGLVALGLMFSNAPSVHAKSTGMNPTDLTSTEAEVAGLEKGVIEDKNGAEESAGGIEKNAEAAAEAVHCCTNILLTPAERAARARVFEQVLTSRSSSLDRVRLGLFLQFEAHLSEGEEREIS